MNRPAYDLSDEQVQFRDVIQAYLRKSYGEDARRLIAATRLGYSRDVWRELAQDIGIFGMGFGESHGGYDGTALSQVPIMEALGHALLLEPYLETVVLCGSILTHCDGPRAAALIEQIIGGEARLALAHLETTRWAMAPRITANAVPIDGGYRLSGRKTVVMAAPWADNIIFVAHDSEGIAIFDVAGKSPGLHLEAFQTIDGRRAADLELVDVEVDAKACLLRGAAAEAALAEAYQRSILAICAEAVGIMRRLVADTRTHLVERRQFGVPLASFQVLQHRLADILIALETSSAMVFCAAGAIDLGAKDRQQTISAAKAYIGRAVHRSAQGAVQMHGGMGMTDALFIGQLFKRAVAIEAQFGSTEHHVRQFQVLRRTDLAV